MAYPISYTYISPEILEIRWPMEISEPLLLDLLSLKQKIEHEFADSLWDLRIGYHTISLKFSSAFDEISIIEQINQLHAENSKIKIRNRKRWHIPVLYDGKDLRALAEHHEMEMKEVINKHQVNSYLIHFYGFLPGFMYLGGLSEDLHTPRKKQPDPKIAAGSVAIGGKQTGIYPTESPGGWNIIGRTPLKLFQLDQKPPVRAEIGDEIKFIPVNTKEFNQIESAVEKNQYQFVYESI